MVSEDKHFVNFGMDLLLTIGQKQARLMAQPPTCSLDSCEGCLEVQPDFLSATLRLATTAHTAHIGDW